MIQEFISSGILSSGILSSGILNSGILNSGIWLGQVIVQPSTETTRDAAFVFSGPQFLAALVTGVVLAFAFQLLLTNLGVALGISLAGASGSTDDDSKEESNNFGSTIRKISLVLGLGTLISVAISLFIACSLAVKLSLFVSPVSGAIVGLVIWGTYFSLLVWVSSSTVGSLIGSVVNTATSGFQAIMGTAAAAIGVKATSKQMVATAESAAAAVRHELGLAFDSTTLKENVEEYLESVRPQSVDLEKIAADFEELLDDENLQEIVNNDRITDLNRDTFAELIGNRSDLSQRDVNRIADKLDQVWQKTAKKIPVRPDRMIEFVDYLKSATREELIGNSFARKLDDLVAEMRKRRKSQESQDGIIAQATTTSFNGLAGIIMGRTDLSDLDVGNIISKLQRVGEQLGEQTDKVATKVGIKEPIPQSTVCADIENYLLNAYPWELKPENLNLEFRDLIYDPSADPGIIARDLRQINRADFVDWLQQKGILTQAKIQTTANLLEVIRLEILGVAEAAQAREASITVFAEAEDYLLTTPKADFSPEKIQLEFKEVLADPDADYQCLSNRLAQFDRPTLERILEQRKDMDRVEISAIVNELEIAQNTVLKEASETFGIAKAKAEKQWYEVQSYLRETGKTELNPMAIQRELKLLLNDPQAGTAALRARLAQFDRDTLVQLLTQRNDLTPEQVNEIIDSIEANWTKMRYTPERIASKALKQYQDAKSAISEYLYSTGKAELNPEGIKRDLTLLLDNPKLGAAAIKRRLAAMDRDTLVKFLSQRDDLSEEQVNQVINEVQNTLREVAKTPKRIARRAQSKIQDFQGFISEYLRSTDKEELNPEGIKRDVQLLINDPRAGMESLQERLAQFDRSTLVALLSQRDDLSEEEVKQVIDQIISVRDQFLAQLQKIQEQVQSVIDNLLEKIRNYLNSLDCPELEYDQIKKDVQTLFDDPEAGFEALRDRFSQIDRNTLIALMASRDDISKADAERIIRQIERTRNRVLQRAERIQQEAQLRLEKIKLEAKKQAQETRKAAAVASWWLFCTALISAVAAATGGAISVTS
ncbi:MFS transporter [Mastigocoleus sp. MO_188.B34]|uniref:MFS transporter n=1 Tax=Mastigocoleus sp. MO_188.B34 TaxID=3036635 RepID=UPI0026261DF1|nr:MFS transporter [Mastigocoleus sp. MO_188.B34]MDJ0695882.1 MFS transporter [Mastigocoleus sp. MO_188.B34]